MRTYVLLFIVALFLLLSSAHAEETQCLIVKKISNSHRTLQQGGDIVLTARLVTSHCRIPIDAVGAVKRAVLSVEAPDGFRAGQPTIEIGEIEDSPVTGPTWMAHEMTVRIPLHAYYGAPAGGTAVPATLTYTAIDEQGNSGSHSLALSIPVQVVPPPKPGFWDEHRTARDALVLTGEVLLGIIVLPLWMVGSILGFFQWDC
jgi:hypothetical protein